MTKTAELDESKMPTVEKPLADHDSWLGQIILRVLAPYEGEDLQLAQMALVELHEANEPLGTADDFEGAYQEAIDEALA